MKQFLIHSEGLAEKAAADVDERFEPDWFCPLINGMCNKKCVCYVPAGFVEARTVNHGRMFRTVTHWRIRKPYCGNPMFSG